MREIIVRFDSIPESDDAQGAVVCGSVTRLADTDRAPIRFDGWLQLLCLLEDLSSMSDESPEPPRPLPSTGLH